MIFDFRFETAEHAASDPAELRFGAQALNAELAAPDPKLDDLSDEELARLQAEVPRPPFPA